jgi:hypothetical protein
MEVDKIKCAHYFVHFHVFVECSSLSLVLVMFSLFCPLPCLRGVLESAPLLTLGANSSTPRRLGSGQNIGNITNTRCNSSTPRYYFVHFHVFVECSNLHLVLVMLSLFCLLPCLRGVLEFAPSVSNVIIILFTSMSLPTIGANSSTPRRDGSGQNNENITNTRGKFKHSTKTWKWTRVCP